MKRRDFFTKCTAGILGMGLTGCSATKPRKIQLWKELSHFSPRPSGTMPITEIGKTGIKVSKLGFGSHIRKDMVPYRKQREHVIREAYDLGINLFDVYDNELECYQYEPMGKFLKPMINDVVISTSMKTYEGRTMEQEFERSLRLFGRDYIDMVRCHAFGPNHPRWGAQWEYAEKLFKYKEKGYIRAVGIPIHDWEDIDIVLDTFPMDYVIFPYNFYHNICWLGEKEDNFDALPAKLRNKGIGVITMKPFAGDYLVKPFIEISRHFIKEPEITYPHAALRYIINSGINPETTLCGMYTLYHLYENLVAFFEPEMSDEERALLNDIKRVAKYSARAWLPEHYKWLEDWAESPEENYGHS